MASPHRVFTLILPRNDVTQLLVIPSIVKIPCAQVSVKPARIDGILKFKLIAGTSYSNAARMHSAKKYGKFDAGTKTEAPSIYFANTAGG
jgi:hypothetical protein